MPNIENSEYSKNSKNDYKNKFNQISDLDNSFLSKNDLSMSNTRISIRGG